MIRTLMCLVAVFSLASAASAQEGQRIMRFQPDGPAGMGLEGDGPQRSHVYYRSDDNPRISAGVWEASSLTSEVSEARYSEFMYLLEGSLTLIDGNGREETFTAGDAVFIPRGTRYTWKQPGLMRKYWVIFDLAPSESGQEGPCAAPTFTRLDPDGPADGGLTSQGRTKSHRYYAGRNGSSVGVWETAPHTASGFHESPYAELMVFLDGMVTMAQPDGTEQTFEAGEVALVPRGASYQWKSDTVRKFWVIFDRGDGRACERPTD